MELSIIIPAFNEERRIEATLRSLSEFLRTRPFPSEILVIDDGSSDGTVPLLERLRLEIPSLRFIATSPNRGKGHAVRTGMLAATGRIRLMYDADGSMPAAEIPRLLEPIFAGRAAIAIGSRYVNSTQLEVGQPWWRRVWSRLANKVVRESLVPGVRDTQCGFKAFEGSVAVALFSRARIDGWAFDLEVLALAWRLGCSIEEVGIRWRDDDRSRVSPARDFFRVIREWVTILHNFHRGAYGRLEAGSSGGPPLQSHS